PAPRLGNTDRAQRSRTLRHGGGPAGSRQSGPGADTPPRAYPGPERPARHAHGARSRRGRRRLYAGRSGSLGAGLTDAPEPLTSHGLIDQEAVMKEPKQQTKTYSGRDVRQ